MKLLLVLFSIILSVVVPAAFLIHAQSSSGGADQCQFYSLSQCNSTYSKTCMIEDVYPDHSVVFCTSVADCAAQLTPNACYASKQCKYNSTLKKCLQASCIWKNKKRCQQQGAASTTTSGTSASTSATTEHCTWDETSTTSYRCVIDAACSTYTDSDSCYNNGLMPGTNNYDHKPKACCGWDYTLKKCSYSCKCLYNKGSCSSQHCSWFPADKNYRYSSCETKPVRNCSLSTSLVTCHGSRNSGTKCYWNFKKDKCTIAPCHVRSRNTECLSAEGIKLGCKQYPPPVGGTPGSSGTQNVCYNCNTDTDTCDEDTSCWVFPSSSSSSPSSLNPNSQQQQYCARTCMSFNKTHCPSDRCYVGAAAGVYDPSGDTVNAGQMTMTVTVGVVCFPKIPQNCVTARTNTTCQSMNGCMWNPVQKNCVVACNMFYHKDKCNSVSHCGWSTYQFCDIACWLQPFHPKIENFMAPTLHRSKNGDPPSCSTFQCASPPSWTNFYEWKNLTVYDGDDSTTTSKGRIDCIKQTCFELPECTDYARNGDMMVIVGETFSYFQKKYSYYKNSTACKLDTRCQYWKSLYGQFQCIPRCDLMRTKAECEKESVYISAELGPSGSHPESIKACKWSSVDGKCYSFNTTISTSPSSSSSENNNNEQLYPRPPKICPYLPEKTTTTTTTTTEKPVIITTTTQQILPTTSIISTTNNIQTQTTKHQPTIETTSSSSQSTQQQHTATTDISQTTQKTDSPQQTTTSSSSSQQNHTTITTINITTTETPKKEPTTVSATISPNSTFSAESFQKSLADQLGIDPVDIVITQLNSTTIDITFLDKNATTNVKEVLSMDENHLKSLNISSVKPAPEDENNNNNNNEDNDDEFQKKFGISKKAVLGALIPLTVLTLGAVYYGFSKWKARKIEESGGRGTSSKFNLEYDFDGDSELNTTNGGSSTQMDEHSMELLNSRV